MLAYKEVSALYNDVSYAQQQMAVNWITLYDQQYVQASIPQSVTQHRSALHQTPFCLHGHMINKLKRMLVANKHGSSIKLPLEMNHYVPDSFPGQAPDHLSEQESYEHRTALCHLQIKPVNSSRSRKVPHFMHINSRNIYKSIRRAQRCTLQ